jgi:uncharacterized membrane protein
MNGLLAALTVVAAVGCGLNAGVFFAFSSFVMKALARLQPAQGHRATPGVGLEARRADQPRSHVSHTNTPV